MNRFRPHHPSYTALAGVAALTALLWSATSAFSLTIRYERTLELSQDHDGRARPVAVSCDGNQGEICVTESAYSALHVFNAAGVETFRTGGFANLLSPNDGTVDHDGRLVATTLIDGRRGTISRLDIYGEPDGYRPEAPADSWRPGHLIVMRDGHYLTLDTTSGLLAKHDANTGALLWSATIGDGQADDNTLEMDLGRPVELGDGTICVPGGNLHVVLILSAEGKQLESFGRVGSSPGRMFFPVAAAAAPDGGLFVLDQLRHKILAFSAQHEFKYEYGSIGDAPGAFYHPVSMAADAAGHLYVAQGFKSRVQVFSVLADGAVE